MFRWVTAVILLTLSLASGDSNITILTPPINLTSWGISVHNALHQPLVRPVSTRLLSAVNDTLDFVRNVTVGCTPQGEECIPEVPSCCPSMTNGLVEDEDLQCLPQGDTYRCSLLQDSEDAAQLRLKALEYGDSAGHLESHPWVNSWEFQSRSEAEREELQAQEESEWKKYWKPSSQENFWVKTYKKVKNEAINVWKDLRKMKKLKEVKDTLIDKKNKRIGPTIPPVEQESAVTGVTYPDELSYEYDEGKSNKESEEVVIKFPDELPEQDKKLDFRLDDVIKDALDLASKKLKKNTKQGSKVGDDKGPGVPLESDEEVVRLNDIQATVDKLMREVDELKALKTQRDDDIAKKDGLLNIENKANGPNIDELIKKHVRNILEERGRLYQLRKLEEAEIKRKNGR